MSTNPIYSSFEVEKFKEFCAELYCLNKVCDTIHMNSLLVLNNTDEKLQSALSSLVNGDEAEEEAPAKKELNTNANELTNNTRYIRTIWNKIRQFIQNYRIEAEKNFAQTQLKKALEVQYLMAILADETFVRKDTSISEFWSQHLLEYHFFETRSAGNIFFDRIDALLNQRDSNWINIGYIYLVVIGLGFRGKYYNSVDISPIMSYKKDLFSYVYKRELGLHEGVLNRAEENNLFVLERPETSRLPNIKKWLHISLGAFILYVIFSFVIWNMQTHKVESMIDSILKTIHENDL